MRPISVLRRAAIILALLAAVVLPKLGQRVLAAGAPNYGQHAPLLQIVLDDSVFYLPLLLGPPFLADPGSAPFQNAPPCPDHNPRAYHGLWDSDRGCHYNHHHGDDPREVDDVLGTDIYDRMGGEISYPWQTFSVAGGVTYMENDAKHAGYFWHVRRDMPCDQSPCIRAFRALVHQHQTGRDATVRYHSYVIEYATSDGGYALFGGWADFGDLHSPEGTIVVDVPDNHDSNSCGGAGRHKQHAPQGGSIALIWYGASQQVVGDCGPRGFVTLSVSGEPWDATDPADPARFDDYTCYGLVPADRCFTNGTRLRPHLIGLNMVTRWDDMIDADGDGVVNWEGYADRYGQLLSSPCSPYGVDCVPVVFRNLRSGYHYGAAEIHTAGGFREYDIYFCDGVPCSAGDRGVRSSGWNQPVP